MWERSWLFLKKAGTVILAASVLIWFFSNWPAAPAAKLETSLSPDAHDMTVIEASIVGRTGKAMEGALKAIGLDWKVGTALISAVAAKEIFVSQMAIVYGTSGEGEDRASLQENLSRDYPPLAGVALLLFTLIASPCTATVAVTRRETGSWKWAALQWGGLTVLGYLLALVVFQGGRLLGLGV
jgi:ferrous iron transport protein B